MKIYNYLKDNKLVGFIEDKGLILFMDSLLNLKIFLLVIIIQLLKISSRFYYQDKD